MRTLIVLVALLMTASSLAQGVMLRMFAATGDDTIVVAEATNIFRVPFIEVDREIPNVEFVLRLGILEERTTRFVLITPTTVHVVERDGEEVKYSTPDWDDRMFTSAASRFNRSALTGVGEGNLLKPAPVVEGLGYRPGTLSSPRSSPGSTCTSTTSATGSSMTCYSGGRLTYSSTCRVHPVTHAITCTSRSH